MERTTIITFHLSGMNTHAKLTLSNPLTMVTSWFNAAWTHFNKIEMSLLPIKFFSNINTNATNQFSGLDLAEVARYCPFVLVLTLLFCFQENSPDIIRTAHCGRFLKKTRTLEKNLHITI